MKINCIIIEDEPLAAERIRAYVEKVAMLELVAVFDNALDAMSFLQTDKSVSLLFLDIEMDDLTGIEFLETTNPDQQVILTTAYDQYALKGYELNVADYLLKPITFDRFLKAVNKVFENITPVKNQPKIDYLFVKTENRLEKVNLDDILYIEGMRDYRKIHLKSKRIMTLQKFSEFEQQLPSELVCRVHKSYMVAVDKIEFVERNRVKINNQLIPISETYKQHFFSIINQNSK